MEDEPLKMAVLEYDFQLVKRESHFSKAYNRNSRTENRQPGLKTF